MALELELETEKLHESEWSEYALTYKPSQYSAHYLYINYN